MTPRAVIVGGGITGLSAAYYLNKAGIPSLLIERRPRLGGVVTTEVVDDCIIEGGPDSFLAAKPWALELIRELGLADEVIGSNDHLRVTYVLRRGRLVPLPDGLMMMIPTRIAPMIATPLLGWGTKFRMLFELFRRPGRTSPGDRSVADFVRDHYGQEAVDYLAEPLLAGVYGGDPRRLSVASVLPRFVELERRYGSLTRGVLAAMKKARAEAAGKPLFQTLKGGLGRLTEAIERAIAGACEPVHAQAEALDRGQSGWRVRAGGQWIAAEALVLACPAYEAAALLRNTAPGLARELESIPYSSSMTVALGYERAGFSHHLGGFGFLVPARERKRLVACTWVGTKFPYRVSDSRVLLRCFLGGAEDAAVLEEPDETVIAMVREELRRIMGVTETPVFARIHRWPRSMAQYTVGHGERVKRIEQETAKLQGLHLAGNAYHGIGIPDCIRTGKQAAEEIAASLGKASF